jgi:hypothetical protein
MKSTVQENQEIYVVYRKNLKTSITEPSKPFYKDGGRFKYSFENGRQIGLNNSKIL